jgi:cytochrome P450
MSTTQERSPSELPVLDADFLQDPQIWASRELDDAPAHQVLMPSGLAVWLVTKYDEAKVALSDPRFSKDAQHAGQLIESKLPPGAQRREFDSSLASHMLNMDPPDHTRLRKLVVKAFTARRVEALRPRVEEITARLLDRMAEQSEVDLLDALAFPLPIQVICELLGVDESRRDEFRAWSNALIGAGAPEVIREAGMHMAAYLGELVETKRRRPADDLVSALIEVSEDEDRLSELELIGMVFLLLIAGHETTVNLIGNCVMALLNNPEQFAALRENPDLVPDAVEETLRFNGPVNLATMRHTTEAVRLGDVEIPAGELVFVSLNTANRDGDRFDEPGRFDLAHSHSGHLAFGHGIHFCVGAQLARLEAQVALRRLIERFPHLAAAEPTDSLRWRMSMIMRGLEKLPVRLR